MEGAEHRQLTVTDIVPLQNEDYNGLTGFYLIIGWLVGGYLVASLLGIAKGSRPSTLRRARFRLGMMVVYSMIGGLGGAIVTLLASYLLHRKNRQRPVQTSGHDAQLA